MYRASHTAWAVDVLLYICRDISDSMNFCHQGSLTVFILCVVLVILFVRVTMVRANKIKCSKKDECSCVTSNKPQLEVSLWPIKA